MSLKKTRLLLAKLSLENLIYARAYALRVPIYACRGKLKSACWEPGLQIALYVYNCAFSMDNARFYPEDIPLLCANEPGGIKNGWVLPTLSAKNLDKMPPSML